MNAAIAPTSRTSMVESANRTSTVPYFEGRTSKCIDPVWLITPERSWSTLKASHSSQSSNWYGMPAVGSCWYSRVRLEA